MKVKRRPGPAVSPGEAPDKDLATPIPTEQRLPAPQTCAIQHLPRRKQRAGGRGEHERTPRSLGSAPCCIPVSPAWSLLPMGTDAQDAANPSLGKIPGSPGFGVNSRHCRGLRGCQGLHHRHRPVRNGRNPRNGLALKALLPFIN